MEYETSVIVENVSCLMSGLSKNEDISIYKIDEALSNFASQSTEGEGVKLVLEPYEYLEQYLTLCLEVTDGANCTSSIQTEVLTTTEQLYLSNRVSMSYLWDSV
jgi:hypothetical protein